MAMPQQAAPAQAPQPPGLANVFYAGAVKFAGDKGKQQSMADVADFQGRAAQAKEAMELALEGEGGENAENAYERLMSMSEENPGATINELLEYVMKGRG
jgi:hypothetical protein